MAYRALDIANYVTNYALKTGKKIYHLQLQKILYYLEAAHLVKYGKPLFEDDIEMWKLGPVVPHVYHEYKEFGSAPIDGVPREIVFNSNWGIEFKEFNEDMIKEDTKQFINPIVDKLIKIDSFELVEMTHQHKLWKDRQAEILSGVKNIKYDKNELKEYFMQNPEELSILGI